MELKAPRIDDMHKVLSWRNSVPESLRTSVLLTAPMQEQFYAAVICNRNSLNRYFTIFGNGGYPVGFGGLTNIQWENSIAEISLIINPLESGKGNGTKAVDLLLDQAFNKLNLKTVFGECYWCNPATNFWAKIIKKYNAHEALLPNRKYWDGAYHNATYFSIDRDDYAGE